MITRTTGLIDISDLIALTDVQEISDYLNHQRTQLLADAGGPQGGLALSLKLSDLVDSVIRHMFNLSCRQVGRGATPTTIQLSIVATGGYGRRELCPFSDIDITFIPQREGDQIVDSVIREMFSWLVKVFIDRTGLEVGYAYRLLSDCQSLDHQTATGLLDARLIAGSERVLISFEDEYWTNFNPAEFVFTKLSERRAQVRKHGNTPRLVEPNLKDGPGGLRDIHAAMWLVQARSGLHAARMRGDRSFQMMLKEGELLESEIESLSSAKEFMFRVRNALHASAGAERDQLVVTRQEDVATRLGYIETKFQSTVNSPPVERFMRQYYAHSSEIYRICHASMRRSERSRLVMGIGLDCVHCELESAHQMLVGQDPVWILSVCELAQKYSISFADSLQREICEQILTDATVRDTIQAADVFTRILSSNDRVYLTLQNMANCGILAWVLPEVGAVMNQIPYDQSHDFTVGQHTLMVIRHLDNLLAPPPSDEMRDYHQIMAELPNRQLLYLAALLHDVGKGHDDRPHAEVGEEIAYAVCQRMGWNIESTETVAFLVKHHLLMSETSRLRDLTQDKTIRDFTSIVNSQDRLHMLYLLTYADTNAVGDGIWTEVKGRFQRELLHKSERILGGEDVSDYDDARLTRVRRQILRELAVENLPPDEVSKHIESTPPTYLLNTSIDEMTLHIGYVRRARDGDPVIDFHDKANSTYTEVTVCTQDDPKPGLLAKIAAVFYAADVVVHSAQVFTRVDKLTSDGSAQCIAIDNFYVDFRGRQLTPGKRKELATHLSAALSGTVAAEELLRSKNLNPEIGGPVESITVRNDLSDTHTVVEVTASDPRSMLYRASAALSALSLDIHSARMSNFKTRNVIGFYVGKVPDNQEADVLRRIAQLMPISTAKK